MAQRNSESTKALMEGSSRMHTHTSISLPAASLLLLMLMLCSALLPPASAQLSNSTVGFGYKGSARVVNSTEYSDVIVIFKDLKSVLSVRAMCSKSKAVFLLRAAALGLPADCHMPGMCRHVYSSAVFGFSGRLSDKQLSRMQHCLPRAVWYRELDGVVHKAEDTRMQDGFGILHNSKNRRLEQTQQSSFEGLSSATFNGNPFDASGNNGKQQQSSSPPQPPSDTVQSRLGDGGRIDLYNLTCGGPPLNAIGSKTQWVNRNLWNLDRVDQRQLPLNDAYTYGSASSTGTGNNVTIYVVDSGVLITHQEFQKFGAPPGTSRASYGFDFIDNKNEAGDCDGHGTIVAGIAAGLQVGIAKDAEIVSVRMLDCSGSGTISNTVAALDWVASNAKKPAVVTLSLGVQEGSWSRVLDDAVRNLISKQGITVVVAAGNSALDACNVAPANVPEAITVAATSVDDEYNRSQASVQEYSSTLETMYTWSNTGPCIDIFAPGVNIYSACGAPSRCAVLNNSSYTLSSGTSMAAPLVAGVAAVFLSTNKEAQPSDVSSSIVSEATMGTINASEFKQGTPNRMIYSKIAAKNVAAAGGP